MRAATYPDPVRLPVRLHDECVSDSMVMQWQWMPQTDNGLRHTHALTWSDFITHTLFHSILMRTLSPARRRRRRLFARLLFSFTACICLSARFAVCDFVCMLFLFIIIRILILLFIYLCLSAGAASTYSRSFRHLFFVANSPFTQNTQTHYARMAFRNAFNACDKMSDRKWRTCRQLTL